MITISAIAYGLNMFTMFLAGNLFMIVLLLWIKNIFRRK